jgi:cell division protein FtsW
MAVLSADDRSHLGRWWWSVDRPLLAAMLILAALGVGLVASASPAVATRIGVTPLHFIIRHVVFMIPAIGVMFLCSMLSAKQIWRLATLVGGIGLFGVLVSLFAGVEVKGATRWVSLAGFSVQPSEFLKPCFVVFAGWLLARQKTTEGFPGLILAFGLYIGVVTLLMAQPDLGMTILVTGTFFAMIFLAGCPLRYIVMMVLGGVLCLVAVYFTFGHVQSRIDRFINPDSGDTYQVDRSLEAFASGGLFGTGPGAGQVKKQLPDAHADFIFSVAAEELGMIFTVLMTGLYAFIILRGFQRLRAGNSVFAMLGGGGLLVMLGFQACIHMGSATQLLPAKGMTLPLVSYGGSSLVAVGMTMGIILALTKGQGTRRHDFRWKPAAGSEF